MGKRGSSSFYNHVIHRFSVHYAVSGYVLSFPKIVSEVNESTVNWK